ncbi:Fic family protein [Candidatus Margulisiibacteriota bacterium]
MRPPFNITPEVLNLCAEITRVIGQFESLNIPAPQPQLRRQNRIKTIHSSLAIEGNRLTKEQVTDIINKKRVVGPKRDIIEVKNAIAVYDSIRSYKTDQLKSLLKAHRTMLAGLTDDAGRLRSRNVGVFKGSKVTHMAPKYQLIPKLINNLFTFVKSKDNLHPLIKSSVFHYELEFIHPFSDGNGRIGRLWQTTILLTYHPFFEYIPVESIIRKKQSQYYKALALSDKAGNSTKFIEFMLKVIYQAVQEFFAEIKPGRQTSKTRIELARDPFKKNAFSRKDYLSLHKTISTATASRDLLSGIKQKILKKSGKNALTKYCFVM